MRAFWSLTLSAVATVTAAADPLETPGKIDEVIVYRGQALVTRLVPVPAAAGLHELIVTGLPEHVLPGSLYAEAPDGVAVRSVRYRVRPVGTDVRDDVRKLDEQLQALADGLVANQRHVQLINARRAYLDKLEQFTAATANVELTRGILNNDTLEKLSQFLLSERQRLVEEELLRDREQRDLKARQELAERERSVLTGDAARTLREAVLFVHVRGDAGGDLRLRYLVSEATWTPSYNVRAAADRRSAVVEYYGSIQQMSGEDWTDVAMTLSTATPSLTAEAPALTPLALSLTHAAPPAQSAAPAKGYAQARRELQQSQRKVENERGNLAMGSAAPPLVENDQALNRLAAEMQILDLAAGGRLRPGELEPLAEGYSVVYRIADRTSLPSRSDQQLIQIASLPLEGEFYKVAAPVLTGYIYDEARLTNGSDLVLLAGPVTTYLGGQFVGLATLPTIAAGEEFTVGLGIDSTLRAARELVDRKETVQGGNRLVDFTYRLTIENFGDSGARVRIMDRLPVARGADIKVTLGQTGAGFRGDSAQTAAERRNGILRWDVEAAAHTAGDQALAIKYDFRLEYDKQMVLAGLAGQ